MPPTTNVVDGIGLPDKQRERDCPYNLARLKHSIDR